MFNNIQEIKTGVFTASLPTGIEVIVKNNVREDEIRILRLLQDGYHIIRILPQADPNLVVMMQEGDDLLSVKELSSSYRHSYTQSIMWIKSMASAVQHCHRHNIAHMDLSLENFVISKTSGMPILIDFGLSKRPWFVDWAYGGGQILEGSGHQISDTMRIYSRLALWNLANGGFIPYVCGQRGSVRLSSCHSTCLVFTAGGQNVTHVDEWSNVLVANSCYVHIGS